MRLHGGGCLCHLRGVQEKVGIAFGNMYAGIGKYHVAIADQPAKMVTMQVGQDNIIDLIRVISRRLKVIGQVA